MKIKDDHKNIPKPKERSNEVDNDKVHHSTEWYYFSNFDKEFRLCDQTEMPTWDIVEDPKVVEYSWSSMTIAQELDPQPGQAYVYDEMDKMMDPIDLSKIGYKSKMDTAKLIDIPTVPYDLDWEYTNNMLATQRWTAFRYTPQIFYEMAHLRNEAKIKFRNWDPVQLPTLRAYFETLPSWCTNNPFIRDVMFGLEKKHLETMVDKQVALNFACSLFTPIDELSEEILTEMVTCRKKRLNHAEARRMMTELKPREIEPVLLGTSYHANYSPGEEVEEEEFEKDEKLSQFESLTKKRKKSKYKVVSISLQ